jgi:hypothetical protein
MNGRESSPAILHALPTQRSKDTRTAEQVAQFIPWVSSLFLISLTWITDRNARLRASS